MKNLLIIVVLLQFFVLGLSAQVSSQFGFEENKGQVKTLTWKPRPDVLFAGNTQGMVFHLRQDGISFQLNKCENCNDSNALTEIYRVDVNWVGANKGFEIETGCMLDGYCNYYNVPVGSEPALFVKQYESVKLKNLWQGVDLHYYFNEQGILESDWLVEPGADYRQIQFEVKGATVSIDPAGYLLMQTPLGEIREGKLRVFQNNKSQEANWKLEEGKVGFEINDYDPLFTLRIDPPVLLWSTYYGGNQEDQGNSIAYSKNGGIAMAGYARSLTNIASDSAHKSVLEEEVTDAFLSLFDSSGKRIWATYYGGIMQDVGVSCVFDNQDNLFLYGTTRSKEQIATDGAFQTQHYDRTDIFIAKFNLDGARQWATYYGGAGEDEGGGLTLDTFGNIYISFSTRSSDNIATEGVWQEKRAVGFDAFLAKFDSSGNRLWGTYFGGENHDEAYGVCISKTGDIYVCGGTMSKNNIASDSAHQIIFEGPIRSFWGGDAFLTKFDSSGSRLWSTYYGGTEGEIAYGCLVDNENHVYLVGGTNSLNNISSEGAHQTLLNNTEYNIPSNPPGDGFITKFNPDGKRIWGTYFGSDSTDILSCGCFDDSGYLYLGGWTYSPQGIATPWAHRTAFVPPWDVMLLKMDKNGEVHWSTYFGGDGSRAYSCVSDNIGHVYITGSTGAPKNFSTDRVHQEKYGGRGDAFLAKFDGSGRYHISVPEVPGISSDILVYPNPAEDKIKIDFMENPVSGIIIQDIHGKTIYNAKVSNYETSHNIDVRHFSQGIYFVRIVGRNGVYTKKVVKE